MAKFNPNMTAKEKVKEFLRELTKLSKKYDIYIGGCGCCGSPFLYGKGVEGVKERYNLDFEEDKYYAGR